jgi:hypothetical protein
MIGGRSGEWHWLWDAYVFGMCRAAAGVVMLDHRVSHTFRGYRCHPYLKSDAGRINHH